MLSPYGINIQEQFGINMGQVAKLIQRLASKKNYALHYRNLQLYLSLGLKLKKVHRVLEFDQSPWLAQYINSNTQKRRNAKNAFENDFFKLLNNSVFGKTMENIRKRVDVRLVTDQKKLSKLASKPTFVNSKIFSEDLVAVHKIKEILTLDRPAYVGMCILDLSKTLMSVFHYNYVKSRYNNKAKLLFTDTDSLCYEIETKDIYKELREDKQLFDNSDYPKDSLYFSVENKKVIGKFKDEAAGMPIREFIGLRSKMYSYVKDNGKNEKTAKGVRKYVIKKNITHDNYKDCLLNGKQMLHSMRTIRSDHPQIGSYLLNKISLSCFDDKRGEPALLCTSLCPWASSYEWYSVQLQRPDTVFKGVSPFSHFSLPMLMSKPRGFYFNINKGIAFFQSGNTFTKIHPNTFSNWPYV